MDMLDGQDSDVSERQQAFTYYFLIFEPSKWPGYGAISAALLTLRSDFLRAVPTAL